MQRRRLFFSSVNPFVFAIFGSLLITTNKTVGFQNYIVPRWNVHDYAILFSAAHPTPGSDDLSKRKWIQQRQQQQQQQQQQHKSNLQNKQSGNSSSSVATFNKWLQKLIRSNPSKTVVGEDALRQRLRSAARDETQKSAAVNTVSFNIIMNGYAQQRSIHAAKKADQLLQELLELQQSQPYLRADSYSYASVVNAHAKSNGGKLAALRAEQLLIQMETSLYPAHSKERLTTDVCHNAVMDAWAVSGAPWAGERAESWLRKLNNPTCISYNACIKAYARSKAPMEAQRLLKEMQMLANTTHPHLEPDKISISTCIDAWSKYTKNTTYATLQAESLLFEMEREFVEWNNSLAQSTTDSQDLNTDIRYSKTRTNKQPDIFTYTSVLSAYAKSGMPDAAEKALGLIRRMERFSDERPNAAFFNTFINLLSKTAAAVSTTRSTKNSVPEQVAVAESIFAYMKHNFNETGNKDMRPCRITYTALISVYATHFYRQKDVVKRTDELLNELLELYDETELDAYLPNAKTFGAVLSVWAKAASTRTGTTDDEASSVNWFLRSESLLKRMELLYLRTGCEQLKPTSILFSQIFRILANGRDPNAARHGMKLMKRMKKMTSEKESDGYGQNVYLDATMYAYLIVTFTKSKVDNGVELATRILEEVEEGYKAGMGNLKPTSLLYSAVLQAYAKSASAEGAAKAENLLQRTKQMYREGKMYAKPTVLFYNSVIDAYARSYGGRKAAERAEALLAEMEQRGSAGDSELGLTTRSFNAAILAWKNSNVPEAPERAEKLLKRMNEKYKAGDEQCRPDRVTINSIIGVWAKSSQERAASRAEEWLVFLEKLDKPDLFSYNSVIDAYSRSALPDATAKAQALYERMTVLYEAGESDLKPDLITLTCLRKTWMKSNDVEGQRQVGKLILKEVERQHMAKRAASNDLQQIP